MNKKALSILEFDKITERLSKYATSAPGKVLCRKLMPSTDLDYIRKCEQDTTAASSRIFAKGSLGFSGLTDIRPLIKSLEVGSSLGISELLSVAALLSVTGSAIRYDSNSIETNPDVLSERFNILNPLSDVLNEINRCIISETEIADDASTNLKDIRRQQKNVNERIKSELSHMISGSYRTYLQDAVVTTRDGRYCIPVKAEYRSQVPGMIHDQSNTGSTFFIEPMSIVKLNNDLRELEIKESEEISVILSSLSAMAGNYTTELLTNYDMLKELDFIFAKAGFSHSYKGSEPIMDCDGKINIKKGRHPLIDSSKVVPVDIYLGDGYEQLIITGPNTGGKTVTLKTIGLFSLMGQSGLHIPASDNSKLTVFNDIFADIGDEQSIEQSLSTFSSHMKNIVYILKKADSNSLVLFDELCAGTDPTEGAALAISILRTLHSKKITTIATTHYSELKIYALSTDGVENACCEFDVETLRPTYRLLIGIPGKSNAFAISKKLGLSDEIIEAAKEQIDEQDVSFEDVISDLEKSRVTIEKERREIEDYKKEIEALRHKLQEKNDKIDQTRDRILREANEKARDILREAKDTADETIRIFQKAGPGASMKDLEQARQKLRSNIDDKNSKLSVAAKDKPKAPALKPEQLKKGDAVRIVSMGLKGTVSSLPDAKGNLFVQCGIMRTSTNIKDLVRIEETTITTPTMSKTNTGKLRMSKSFSVSPEINLLGKTVDEALAALDKYLDDAYLAHLENVRVVHGKGTGALRKAIQQHLKRIKYVKSFRQGEYGEGDAGVTIVEFKK